MALTQDRRTLGQMFGLKTPRNETIGVRVFMIIEYEDGHYEQASVTANAPAWATLGAAMESAVGWANAGQLGRSRFGGYKITVAFAEVSQLILGGLESPALDLTSQ